VLRKVLWPPVSSQDDLEANITNAPPPYESTGQHFPIQPKDVCEDASIAIHPLMSNDGVVVEIKPPLAPVGPDLVQTSCDIVLVLDVSGSMILAADPPDQRPDEEKSGYSRLDLVKHAASTILETLNENDRLGIVTFGNSAQVSEFQRF